MNFLWQPSFKTLTFLSLNGKCRYVRCFTKIASLLDSAAVGRQMTVQGWVKSKRKMKTTTFIDISDGSTSRVLQVALSKDDLPNLNVGASIKVNGTIERFGSGQIELKAEDVEVIGPCKYEEGYPFVPKRSHPMEHLRQYLHFRPRTNIFSSVLRLRGLAATEFRKHLEDEGYFEVNAPVITSCDCEGAGEVFSVKPDSQSLIKSMAKEGDHEDIAFFGSKTYLSVSGQMHLEAAARGLGHVYTFGPSFRAENSKSRLHLSEFYMLETEEILYDGKLETIIKTIETMLRKVTQNILDKNLPDLETIKKYQIQQSKSNTNVVEYQVDPLSPEGIYKTFLPSNSYSIITYQEAIDILSKCNEKFQVKPNFKEGLSKEHELFLVRHNENRPLFVIDWPAHLKAFYMKQSDSSTVAALDLLVPVVGELCGGSVREDNIDLLAMKLKQIGLEKKLGWYLDMRKFGNISTGGFGLGFERYLQCLLSIPNIKDVIPFPRWPHNCQM